MRANVINT